MNNVVYIKTFENGKVYVGITNNFEHRMSSHKCDAFTRNSQLPVHKAMRKYSHETEIVFQSENYDDVLKYEQIIIQNFKDLGIELYNITDGGQGSLGYGGVKHPNYIDKNLYVNRKYKRADFKRICSKNNWNFKEFKEEFNSWYIVPTTNKKQAIYSYTYIGESNKDYGVQTNEKEYYSNKTTFRSDFKKICKNRNWNFEDFKEIDSGEKIGTKRKYYYIYKGE